MNRIGPVRKPWKGRLARLRVLARGGPRKDEARADGYSGAPVRSAGHRHPDEARERSAGEIPPRLSRASPRREKPKGASGGGRPKPASGREGLQEGAKPRNRGPQGPTFRFGGRCTCGRNGRWVHPARKRTDAFREEKAPKGESQERRRCETKPAWIEGRKPPRG
jgi:hypothetical protein